MIRRFKIIADANVPLLAVRRLREEGVHLLSFVETDRIVTDDEIINFAYREKGYLMTFDRDVADLVVRNNYKAEAVIVLAFQPRSVEYIVDRIKKVLKLSKSNLDKSYVVVDEKRVIIRNLKSNNIT
jgi:predicted nuclease of predicted toxin-antitoxin system